MPGTIRRLTVAIGVDSADMDPGLQAGLAKVHSYAKEVQRQNAELAAAAKQAVSVGAVDPGLDKARQHMEEQVAFYRRIAEDQTKSETLRAKAREKYAAIGEQLEIHAREATMVQEQAKVRLTQAANEERMASDRQLLAERLASEQQAAEAAAAGGLDLSRRSPLMHSLREGGRMAGMSGVGGEATYAGMMLMDLGAVGGGIAGGVMAIAETYKAAQEAAKALTDAQKEHRDLVRDAAEWMEKYTKAATTGAGAAFADRNAELRKKSAELSEKQAAGGDNLTHWYNVFNQLAAVGQGQHGGQLGALEQQSADRNAIAQEMRANAQRIREQEKIEAGRERIRQIMAVEGAQIAAMVDGPEKKRLELLHQQEEARRRMLDEHADRMTLYNADPTKSGKDKAAEAARLGAEEANQSQVFAIQRAAQQAEIARKRNDEDAAAQGEYQDAVIRQTTRGYEREHALLLAKQQREWNLAREHGENMRALAQKQAAERLNDRAKGAEKLEEMNRAADAELRVAQEGDPMEARIEKWRLEAQAVTDDAAAIDAYIDKMKELSEAQNLKGAQNTLAALKDEIEVINGTMTKRQAEAAAWGREHPGATQAEKDAELENLKKKGELDMRRSAAKHRDEADPAAAAMKKYNDEKQEMDKERRAGLLSAAEEAKNLQRMRDQMSGGKNRGGDFMDAISYARNVQSSILKADKDKPLTAADLKGIDEGIAALWQLAGGRSLKVVLGRGNN